MRARGHERRVYTTAAIALASLIAPACVFVASLAGCASDPRPGFVPEPPLLLGPEPGCALYVGGVYGNDEMSVRLVLCASAQTAAGAPPITGTIQFVSPMSGWSVRRVAGIVQPSGELQLADTIFVETHPSMEWQQCLVDLYTLRITKDGLVEGEYVSTPCRDRARVALERAVQ